MYNTTILSDENLFWNQNCCLSDFIRTINQHFKIEIIAYLRESISYLTSFWKFIVLDHAIKGKVAPSFEEVLLRDPKDPSSHDITRSYRSGLACLDQISELIGSENIHLRPFLNFNKLNKKIEIDFLYSIGCSTDNLKEAKVVNFSPNLKQAEMLFYANQMTSSRYVRKEAAGEIMQIARNSNATLSSNEIQTIYTYQKEYENEIIRKYQRSNEFSDFLSQKMPLTTNTNNLTRNLDEEDERHISRIVKELEEYESRNLIRIRFRQSFNKLLGNKYSMVGRP